MTLSWAGNSQILNDGAFSIPVAFESGDSFELTVSREPLSQRCTINGTTTFSSNGPIADLAVLYASTDPAKGYHGGVSAFLCGGGDKPPCPPSTSRSAMTRVIVDHVLSLALPPRMPNDT